MFLAKKTHSENVGDFRWIGPLKEKMNMFQVNCKTVNWEYKLLLVYQLRDLRNRLTKKLS